MAILLHVFDYLPCNTLYSGGMPCQPTFLYRILSLIGSILQLSFAGKSYFYHSKLTILQKRINLMLLALLLYTNAWASGREHKPNALQKLNSFLLRYVEATNTHDFAQVRPWLMPGAVYWFSQKESSELEEIQGSFQVSWSYLPDEFYGIEDVTWLSIEKNSATCI